MDDKFSQKAFDDLVNHHPAINGELARFQEYVRQANKNDCPISEAEFDLIWQGGSIHYPEAVVLYNLARAYEVKRVVEAGAFIGISSKFIVAALRNVTGGHLVSIDRQSTASKFMLDRHKAQRSSRLDEDDLRYVTLITAIAQDFMVHLADNSYDMVFEDTDHTTETTFKIAEQAVRILRPGGILVSHDALMESVHEGHRLAGIFEDTLYMDTRFGLGLWVKPG